MISDLTSFRLRKQYPVLWGQMDAANHVNNVEYMRWAESARIYYFEKMGMDISFGGFEAGPILAWQDCKYIFPITYPDTVTVGIKATEIKTDRFSMQCAIFSDRHHRLAAISEQSIMPYDYQRLKKIPLPHSWVQQIRLIEGI
mgnify:FL=1